MRQSADDDERPETVEAGAHVVAGMAASNIVEAVETVVGDGMGSAIRLNENFSASAVVINCIRSQITNWF